MKSCSLFLLAAAAGGGASAFQSSSPFRLPSAFSRGGASSSSTSSCLSAIDVREGVGRDVPSMEGWANQCGIQRADGFSLNTEDGGVDWFAVATQNMPANSPVLAVPNNVMLTSNAAKAELGGAASDAADYLARMGAGDQIPQFYLFLKVLAEFEKGEASPWFPWLNSLPRLYFNSVSMTNFCYECLPPLVFRLARAERSKFDNFVAALQKVNGLNPEIKSDNDIAKWAFNVVCTRAVGEGNEKAIVPMADMLNHGTETEVALNFDQNGNCNVYTTRDVPAGTPLRMSYGDPTNPSALFATYGFLDETSPATFCKIMTIQPTPELLDIGYDFSRMLFYKDTGDISQEVWDVVLYAQVLTADKAAQQAFHQAHINGDINTKQAIHQQYFPQTANALKEHVDTFLSTLDELGAKADGKDVNEHPRLPLILRHNDFVRQTFLRVKANLDPMVAQAGGGVGAGAGAGAFQ